ncbi:uncharacterized protein MELLADRAFT_66723 [Melampsora larici-populina 98AG31]|uniref:Uncharacterized protein n=1 Tax=Melampsora larici-populina (strain 98AG31 / pathotype 3-4-7) TaxID=747676 RepID=F4S0B6_MELLP|nr:uncharacterized protein MELLADRAFT_66723 [Melampsora larici-populina 98AG31]EGG01934.1 hypothetical protein MELLADRAFT_66723 [Melampsora larici-populina 98AG31]
MALQSIEEEPLAPNIARSSRPSLRQLMQEYGHNDEVDPWTEISEISVGEGSPYKTNATNRLKSEIAKSFEENLHINDYRGFDGERYDKHLPVTIAGILQLEHSLWAEKLIEILEVTEGDLPTQIIFFQILRQLLRFYDIPFNTVQMVWRHLQGVSCMRHDGNEFFLAWKDEARLTLKAYGNKMIDHIDSCKPGEELLDFVDTQTDMGADGLSLVGDWSLKDQKALFAFWILNQSHYPTFKRNPKLQLWIEAQIVQTRLIRRIQSAPLGLRSLRAARVESALSKLTTYSDIILDCHNSLEDNDYMPFFQSKVKIHPYGLQLDQSLTPKDIIDILKFWSQFNLYHKYL